MNSLSKFLYVEITDKLTNVDKKCSNLYKTDDVCEIQ